MATPKTPEPLAELADDLAEHPGESMALFAEQLDVPVRGLAQAEEARGA